MSDGGPFKGLCKHSFASAKESGDAWIEWYNKRYPEWHDADGHASYHALERISCEWHTHILEKYGRMVVWAGAEEFYSENLCAECLREMLAKLEGRDE